MALSFGKGRGSGPVENTSVLPTFTAAPTSSCQKCSSPAGGWGGVRGGQGRGAGAGAQKTPLRGRSGPALMATLVGASAFASLAARVLKAPQLLQASIETGPPPDAGAFAFLAMVFLAPEAFLGGAAFFFFGMAALQATAVRCCVHCQLSGVSVGNGLP